MNTLINWINKFINDIKPFKTSVLAVFIAVTTAVVVSAVSSAGKQLIADEMDAMGLSGMTVSAYNSEGENVTDLSFFYTLNKLQEVSEISPVICNSATAVFSNGISAEVMEWGISPDAADVISLKLLNGRMINNSDLDSHSFICVVDKNLAESVYKRSNICGKKINIDINGKNAVFTVVGTVEKGSNILNTLTGNVIPDFIYIPYTTLSSLSEKSSFDQIIFSGTDNLKSASELKQKLVDENYKYRKHTIKLTNLSAQKDQISNIADTAFLSLFIVSCIAVLVCSMSVGASVNTAVISRHKDIGIKISMGASRWDITKEFLFAAFSACISGIILALIFVGIIIRTVEFFIPFNYTTDYLLIVFSIFATIILTAIFSLAPSYSAAKMSPIKALNRE